MLFITEVAHGLAEPAEDMKEIVRGVMYHIAFAQGNFMARRFTSMTNSSQSHCKTEKIKKALKINEF